MVWQRGIEGTGSNFIGSILYGIACDLYGRDLPYHEADLCDLLKLSRHDCGHGEDVAPPLEIALTYAREHGLSPDLLAAVRVFIGGLKGLSGIKVQSVKRKAGLLLLLEDADPEDRLRCWSDRFRTGLLRIPVSEQNHWRWLVLQMNPNDVYSVPKTWVKPAKKFLADLGPEKALSQLREWWPDPGEQASWPIQTAGSHLLKYLVWLLEIAGKSRDNWEAGDELVRRLCTVDWKPRERAAKVLVASAHYLALRPPSVAWEGLQELLKRDPGAGEGEQGSKIAPIVTSYAKTHGLAQ